MKAQRYQRGSLTVQKRKSLPDTWVFRYYTEEAGCRVYKKQIVGTVLQFPRRKDAEKAVAQLRVDINEGAEFAPMTLEQLAIHYQKTELPNKAYSTQVSYADYLRLHIIPRWGQHALASVKAVEVENWLGNLKTATGKPASPNTRAKIRNILCALFSHAIRYEFAAHNPITSVRTSARRLRTPDILSPEEFQSMLKELGQRERVMVLLAGSTGLRRGELIALRWRDIEFELLQANVTRSIWRNVEGNCKTEASRKPVPLHPVVVQELRAWRMANPYKGDDDFIFASVAKNGSQAMQPDMLLKRHIRPALERLGITKRIGWHSFRHGLGTMLRRQGVDLKTAQELLRHANPRITMELYQQSVSAEKRQANLAAVRGLLGEGVAQHPSAPSERSSVI